MVKKEIGKKIKQLRKNNLELTQDEFAKRLGWDRTYLSRIESGKQNLTLDSLVLICKNLDVSLADFFSNISY